MLDLNIVKMGLGFYNIKNVNEIIICKVKSTKINHCKLLFSLFYSAISSSARTFASCQLEELS